MGTELEEKLKDTLRAARDRIRQLQDELQKAGSADGAAVAVVGLACRFPGGADDPEAFRRLLLAGYDGVGEVPADRFDLAPLYDAHRGEAGRTYVKRAGFLRGEPGLFDAGFFRLAPAEALVSDPQQRHLLELSWRALEDAGIVPQTLRGGMCGVYVGVSSVDYIAARMYAGTMSEIDPWSTTGAMACSAAGRLSYFYDWRGPAVAVDTACSSSLVAIQQAVEALRGGRCDLALAGGVNLMLTPAAFVGLCAMNALAPDGRCKTFSQGADGFGRGEGCGLVVLKRLADAQRDGDRIHAVVLGGAVGHCGVGNGFTAPNGPGQELIVRRALSDAGLAPEVVGLIEAHGTGTPLGDPIELGALQAVYGRRQTPLLVGSVKPNIGHLEAAAGIAGVIKAIFCVRDGEIPPTTHTLPASERIEWDTLSMQVVRERTKWPEGVRRIAGVSSFGISGTGAHLLLAQPPEPVPVAAPSTAASANTAGGSGVGLVSAATIATALEDGARETRGADAGAMAAELALAPARRGRRVLFLSAQRLDAVRDTAREMADWLTAGDGVCDLAPVCAELALRRTWFAHRLAVSGDSAAQIATRLRAWLDAGGAATGAEGVLSGKTGGVECAATASVATGATGVADAAGPVFVFGGQGSQVAGMGLALGREFPVFAQVLQRCEEVWRRLSGGSLHAEMAEPAERSRLGQTRYTQPAIYAFQVALAQLWQSLGVRPALLIGHSIGEYAAACVADVLSVEEGMELVTRRAELVEAHALPGKMAAVFADPEEIPATALADGACVIAACNAPGQTVLAGAEEALERALAACRTAGLSVKPLRVSHAFHAPMMQPVLPHFESVLRRMEFRAPVVPILSTLTGQTLDAATRWPDYFLRQMRQPVRFAEAARAASAQGHRCFLELSAFPVLGGLMRRVLPEGTRILASQRGADGALDAFDQALGGLWCAGMPADWAGAFGPAHAGSGVPGYPFQRKNYYINPARLPAEHVAAAAQTDASTGAAEGVEGVVGVAGARGLDAGGAAVPAALRLARLQAAALDDLTRWQAELLQAVRQ